MAVLKNVASSLNLSDCGHYFLLVVTVAHTDVERWILVDMSLDQVGIVPAAMPLAS